MNFRLSLAFASVSALLLSATTYAGPAPKTDDSGPAPGEPARAVGEIRTTLEGSMANLGELAQDALADSDAVRAACVVDKRDRGAGVMELATADLLVATDSSADAAERNFAVQKLEASSGRLEQLVDQARGCLGDGTPNDDDDTTNNDVDEAQSLAIADPTAIGRQPPVPPPVDDARPPTVGSPTR